LILVDSNILVDIWTNDAVWAPWSRNALEDAVDHDRVCINPIIYSELCIGVASEETLREALEDAGIEVVPVPVEAACPAAHAFMRYRERGGIRTSTLPDFFIGAHAETAGFALLTRDTARYRAYFPEVPLIAPTDRP
jgi:predicted nucleic acid-binding protein